MFYLSAVAQYAHANSNCLTAYMSELVSTVAAQSLRSGLRSTSTTSYILPWLRTKFGERSFLHARPAAWNTSTWTEIYSNF